MYVYTLWHFHPGDIAVIAAIYFIANFIGFEI